MEIRDKLMLDSYFINYHSFIQKNISEDRYDIDNNIDDYQHPERLLYSYFRDCLEIMILKYSMGYDLVEVKHEFINVKEALIQLIQRSNEFKFVLRDLDSYNKVIWLLSFALLLKVDDKDIFQLLACIDAGGEDSLFDVLIATRIKDRKKASSLVFSKKYSKLLLAAQGIEPVSNMKQYLNSWYKSMKDCYWHDNHKGPEGGGYFGYWCWEAAAVSVAFNIDDTEFRNMPYYPKDMADYSRALK